jgi:hypothetical protein
MKYAVKRYWEVCDSVEVEASSVGEAIDTAHAMPVDSTKAEFVPDSINSDSFCDVQSLNTGHYHEVDNC